jgi:hypothetical protein
VLLGLLGAALVSTAWFSTKGNLGHGDVTGSWALQSLLDVTFFLLSARVASRSCKSASTPAP